MRYETAKHIREHFGRLAPIERSAAGIVDAAKRDLEQRVLPSLPEHPTDPSRRLLSERNVVEWLYRHYDRIPRNRTVAAELATFLIDLYHRGDVHKSGAPRATIQEVLWDIGKGAYTEERLAAFETRLAAERAKYA